MNALCFILVLVSDCQFEYLNVKFGLCMYRVRVTCTGMYLSDGHDLVVRPWIYHPTHAPTQYFI